MAHKTKRKDIQKVFYGHRLTQINADGNHKLLINFGRSALLCSVTVKRRMKDKKDKSVSEMCCYIILWVIIYVESYLTEHLWNSYTLLGRHQNIP